MKTGGSDVKQFEHCPRDQRDARMSILFCQITKRKNNKKLELHGTYRGHFRDFRSVR